MADVVHLHLQQGFADDTVAVAVNGVPALLAEKVTTSPLTALALAGEIELPEGGGTVEVEVRSRRLTGQVAVAADGSPNGVIAANIIDGSLVLSRHEQPLAYE